MLGGSGPCNRNGVPLSDRGKKLKQGLRRTMMTWLALANAVMMSICSSLCRDVPGHASVPTEAGDACARPDNGRKHVASNTTGYLGAPRNFLKYNQAFTAR